jgi:menaquinone-dependent protoporphyrinogen oxidase
MNALVVFASRYGATEGIAARIAERFREQGIATDCFAADQAPKPEGYDAVVVGSAAYYFRWMKEATAWVERNRDTLANRWVWMFSSGPLGTNPLDAHGQDLCEVTVPKKIAEFAASIHPREHRVFFGALQPEKLGFLDRLVTKLPINKDNSIFPPGDFRNWKEIDGWADQIAQQLLSAQTVR